MGRVQAPSARRIALRVLRSLEQTRGFSNRVLSAELERYPELDRRDRGLATTLVYGVLRHRARLDALINAVASRPGKLKGELRTILRIAAYELRELDRPAPVAGSEAVRLAKKLDPQGRLRPLITAIVAGIEREGAGLDEAHERRPATEALPLRWSIPDWLAQRWVEQLGPERARARAVALCQRPDVDLRLDLSRASAPQLRQQLEEESPGITLTTVEGQPQCLRARGGGDLFYGPLHDRGLISVQGLGSQQAALALAPQPGERVLDACCGMGTKTLQLAELMDRRGDLTACDSSAKRLESFEQIRRRGGLEDSELRLEVIKADLTQPNAIAGPFDAILVDAPCSGLGDLARHPELRWRASEDDIARNAALQVQLVRACAVYLRPGGRLVYAVCSLEAQECEAVVEQVCGDDRELTLEHQTHWTPEDAACDGFFLARLRKR